MYTASENRPSYRELVFQPSFLKGYVKFRGCGSICGGPTRSDLQVKDGKDFSEALSITSEYLGL